MCIIPRSCCTHLDRGETRYLEDLHHYLQQGLSITRVGQQAWQTPKEGIELCQDGTPCRRVWLHSQVVQKCGQVDDDVHGLLAAQVLHLICTLQEGKMRQSNRKSLAPYSTKLHPIEPHVTVNCHLSKDGRRIDNTNTFPYVHCVKGKIKGIYTKGLFDREHFYKCLSLPFSDQHAF